MIGHADPRVNRAAAEAAATSDITTLGADVLEADLARRIRRSAPNVAAVAFLSTEAGAVQLAVRVAQGATGRKKLLRVGSPSAGPAATRRPATLVGVSGQVRFLDITSGAPGTFSRGVPAGEYAAVIVAPEAHLLTTEDEVRRRLEAAAEVAQSVAAVLILDERASAFRDHLGGYAALPGFSTPLTIIGGAMGNGYGIAGVTADPSLAEELVSWRSEAVPDDVAPPYALAAGIATYDLLARDAMRRLRRTAARLRDGLARAVRDARLPATVTGSGTAWHMSWDRGRSNRRSAWAAAAHAHGTFQSWMLDAGTLLPLSITDAAQPSASFSDDDVDETLEAASRVLARMKAA